MFPHVWPLDDEKNKVSKLVTPSLSLLTRQDLGCKRGKDVRPQKVVVGAHMVKSSDCQLTIGCTSGSAALALWSNLVTRESNRCVEV